MMKQLSVGGLGGFVLGAGLMYLVDPAWGRRRRRVAQDKAVRTAHELEAAVVRTAADMRHRARGMRARIQHLFRQYPPNDRVLEERVRARLGRCCSHPHAIDVFAQDGVLELSGPILTAELQRVLREAGKVRGVGEVKNLLEAHERPENVPSLQGAPTIAEGRGGWPPTGRLLAAVAGAGLVTGFRWRSPLGYAIGAAGVGLLTRSLSNRSIGSMVGLDRDRQSIRIEKTFEVAATVPAVFALWSKLESFPRFLSHVKNVRRMDDGTYRWEVTGPLGSTVAWTAEMNRYIPNRAIAWRSVPGSPVETTGEVRFRPSDLGTRVELRMYYRPPGGSMGHGIAKLLGADPRKQIEDDVIRFKSLLEDGKATGRQETVTGEQVIPGLAGGRSSAH